MTRQTTVEMSATRRTVCDLVTDHSSFYTSRVVRRTDVLRVEFIWRYEVEANLKLTFKPRSFVWPRITGSRIFFQF